MCIVVHISMCACTHTCIYIYIYTSMHTSIHTCIQTYRNTYRKSYVIQWRIGVSTNFTAPQFKISIWEKSSVSSGNQEPLWLWLQSDLNAPRTYHTSRGGTIGRAWVSHAGDGRVKPMTYQIDTCRLLARCSALFG